MVKLYSFFIFVLFLVFSFNFVYSMGCCVSPALDICSANTQKDYCDATGGQFYSSDPSCSSVQVCTLGCCIIGLDASSMTLGKCQLQSQQMGAPSVNFIQTIGDCSQYVSSQESGACIGSNAYGQKVCSYIARTQCYGQFFPGVLCSDASNSPCNKTTASVCLNNNAYYVDSCGNRDSLKEACDYTSGKICKIVSASGMQEARCEDQNCVDDFDFNKYVLNKTNIYVNMPHYNGSVVRKHGEVWCVTEGMVPFSADNLNRDFNLLPNENLNHIFSDTIDSAVGLRFFSRTCIDGQIITEPCDDTKEGYCSGSSWWYDANSSTGTGGTCRSNEYRDCLSADNKDDCDPVNCFWYDPSERLGVSVSQNGTEIVTISGDVKISDTIQLLVLPPNPKNSSPILSGPHKSTSIVFYDDIFNSTAIASLKVSKCLPKIPGGVDDVSSRSTICSGGDYSSPMKMNGENDALYLNAKDLVNVFAGNPDSYNKNKQLNFIPINPEIVKYLDYRCSRIADCAGKINWLGVNGKSGENGLTYLSQSEINDEIKKVRFNAGEIYAKSKRHVFLANIFLPFFGSFLAGMFGDKKETVYLPFSVEYLSLFGGINLTLYDKLPVYYGDSDTDTFEYKCMPTKPPLSGNCSMCEADGTTCTKYKCQSIGKNCQYFEQGGTNGGGTCMLKTDYIPPQITLNCPLSSSIKAQQPINISVGTSESSYCRYNIGSALASYDVMPYDLGTTWGLVHNTILAVPGMNQVKVGNVTQYPLLIKSGNYSMFVRCIDPAGNGDTTPAAMCNFVVPKTPDNNPPVILRYTPATNSPILFNSSVQDVEVLVNEPTECRWSLKDTDYDFMNNSFSCSNQLTIDKDISGYECLTQMNNISKIVGAKTTFYVRCEDQPGLEGNETTEYHRNKNPTSSFYYLVGSDKLNITEVTPQNKLIVGKNFVNWTLTAKTRGGGYSGEAICKWRLSFKGQNASYSEFMNTGGTVHTQTITQIAEGDYILDVKCADKAGNSANVTEPLQIRYDMSAPFIERVYNDKGYMKIVTSELAICKFTNSFGLGFGCGFDFNDVNLTLMTSPNSLSHNANWRKGVSYFIKCQDFYGNLNNGCVVISFGV